MAATTLDPLCKPSPVSLLDAFKYWLKLGFISFGGGLLKHPVTILNLPLRSPVSPRP
jgi:hypothetical protein